MGETGASLVFGALTRGRGEKYYSISKRKRKKERGGQKWPENAFLALLRNSVWEERVERSATDEVLRGLGESDG